MRTRTPIVMPTSHVGTNRPVTRASDEPAGEQRQRVGRVAGERDVVVVRELADRREEQDRDRSASRACEKASTPRRQTPKNLRTPRKSLVRTGTIRTSLAEFGASIIFPPPMYMATWPTTGCS